MALTDNSDIYASFSDDMVNSIVKNVMRQRPSLFNYGTDSFIANPQLMCRQIEVASQFPIGQPLVGFQAPLPVPGTGGNYSIEYCAQLTNLELDMHPSNAFTLPTEISPLAEQSIALRTEACLGIACPIEEVTSKYTLVSRNSRAKFGCLGLNNSVFGAFN